MSVFLSIITTNLPALEALHQQRVEVSVVFQQRYVFAQSTDLVNEVLQDKTTPCTYFYKYRTLLGLRSPEKCP